LRIAAALLRARPRWRCEDLAEVLRPESTRLKELHGGDLAVRTVFGTSYGALGSQDKRAFRMLGVFPGSDFSTDAAAAMIMTPDPAGHLSALADAQLVGALTMKRYRLHDLMRLFARERLDAEESGTAASDALGRLVAYYSASAPAAGPEWITAEAANIAAAARRALADGDLQAVLGLAAAAHGRLLECARPAECVELGDSAVQAARLTGDRRRLAAELTKAGEACDVMGFVQRGVTYLAEALSLWRELGETLVVSRTEAELGNALRNAGDHLAALGHLEHALASYRELGDEAGEIVTLTRLGTLHNVRFDQRAIDVLERAVVICRGGDFGQASCRGR
jgi:tetratricopeptide (TPR) repeat protein